MLCIRKVVQICKSAFKMDFEGRAEVCAWGESTALTNRLPYLLPENSQQNDGHLRHQSLHLDL